MPLHTPPPTATSTSTTAVGPTVSQFGSNGTYNTTEVASVSLTPGRWLIIASLTEVIVNFSSGSTASIYVRLIDTTNSSVIYARVAIKLYAVNTNTLSLWLEAAEFTATGSVTVQLQVARDDATGWVFSNVGAMKLNAVKIAEG